MDLLVIGSVARCSGYFGRWIYRFVGQYLSQYVIGSVTEYVTDSVSGFHRTIDLFVGSDAVSVSGIIGQYICHSVGLSVGFLARCSSAFSLAATKST